MEKTNNRKLAASAVLIVASVALLLGLTFAWFTDTVASKGNRIQAGTLGVAATVAAYDANGSTTVDASGLGTDAVPASLVFGTAADLEADGVHVIDEELWEPGQSNAKLLTVSNAGDLAVKFKIQFEAADDGLQDALWYDFIQVENGSATGSFVKRPMSTLVNVGDSYEGHVTAGGSVQFILVYGMSETAGNAYQGKSFTADVNIVATQDTVEADGFGKTDYDSAAVYPTVVSSADELVDALAEGGMVQLAGDVALTDKQTIAADTTIDLQGNTLTIADGAQSIKAAANTTLTFAGNGTVNGVVYAEKGGNIVIDAGDAFAVNSVSEMGCAVYGNMNANIVINGGTYSASHKGGSNGIICRTGTGGSLSVSDATVNVGADSVVQAAGITSNASTTTLENVTVNAKYSVAVSLSNAYGSSVIRGGSFVTDQAAEGFNPNPTIEYQGALDISGASITRIGTGILFCRSWPLPSEVEGLTYSDLAFIQVAGATGADIDYQK